MTRDNSLRCRLGLGLLRLVCWLLIWYVAQSAALAGESGSTDIEITSRVHMSGVRRFGINLGGQDFYDSGQMLRNLVFRNPGFEAESWRSILRCKRASTTSCTDGNQYAVWPAGFLKGAHFQFLTGTAAGMVGTVVASTASQATEQDDGVSFSYGKLARTPAAGDFVMVSFDRPGGGDQGWWVNTMNSGATITSESTDLSPATPGRQALRMAASGPGQSARVDSYFDSFQDRSFLTLKGRYTLAFRAKGVGGGNALSVGIFRQGKKGNQVLLPTRSLHLPNSWKDYAIDFTANEDGSQVGTVDLNFAVSGASVLLDDVSLTEAAGRDNPTAFRDAVVATLRELQPGILRYSDVPTDAASSLDNLLADPFARVRSGHSTQATTEEGIPLGLHEVLVLAHTIDAEPWYSVPATLTPAEMKNLIEYLAGPPGSPYGRRRAALGQVEPWTHVFPMIHLEFGNELWNGPTFYGAAMPDAAAYGARAGQLFEAARSSPAFAADKFDLVLGSWAISPAWTIQELSKSRDYDSVAVAPYLFNSLVDTSSPEAVFGPMFAEPQMIDSEAGGYMVSQAKAARSASHPARLEVYEVNLGTDQGDAPQIAVDQAVASVGSGLAVIDHMLLMLRELGVNTQSVWALSGYSNRFRNPSGKDVHTPLWGTVIDMGGPTNRRRPVFLAEKMVNEAIRSNMLEVKMTGADPTWAQPRSRNNDIHLAKADILQAFAFAQGQEHSFVVFNLDRTKSHTITLSGEGSPRGRVEVQQLTSAAITDTNEQQEMVRIHRVESAHFVARTPHSLPPFSMTVLTW